MTPFAAFTGHMMPLDRVNVDTDAIIPKQYLKSIKRTGFGPFLFDDWRYLDPGDLAIDPKSRRVNPSFVLNQPQYSGSTILLARDNFGCGSSREHAVWALRDYGFRAVIAVSYGDIFYENCFKNGLLPIVLGRNEITQLFETVATDPSTALAVDLKSQTVQLSGRGPWRFDIDAGRKQKLLTGMDEIGETLQHADAIRAYEMRRRLEAPWLFLSSDPTE